MLSILILKSVKEVSLFTSDIKAQGTFLLWSYNDELYMKPLFCPNSGEPEICP